MDGVINLPSVATTPSVLVRLRAQLENMRMAEAKAARYILENPRDAIGQSIIELAQISGASESTISRLAQRLGYKGFQEFKLALATETVTEVEQIHSAVHDGDDDSTIIRKVISANLRAIEETMDRLDPGEYRRVIQALVNANRVFVFGAGASGATGVDAYNKFLRIGLPVTIVTDTHFQAMSATLCGPGDVIVTFSLSGRTADLVNAMSTARSLGATTITVTNHYRSPITRHADMVLYAASRRDAYHSESMDSRIAQLCIVDAIYVGLAMAIRDRAVPALVRTKQAIEQRRVQ